MPHQQDQAASAPGLILPTPSMQTQIHELAKTLPPPRKQNTACDACRARKVKCHRLPGQEKCQHCQSKNYPCTHYVQQATSEKKRGATVARRPRTSNASSTRPYPIPHDYSLPTGSEVPRSPHINTSPTSKYGPTTPVGEFSQSSVSPPPSAYPSPQYYRHAFYPPISLQTATPELLQYLFAPPENPSDHPPNYGSLQMKPTPYADWGDLAHKLEDEHYRFEFALDLVEVFFQIVHTRLPLLHPAQFRARMHLRQPPILPKAPTHEQLLHPALVATVLAWGTKFSEHPLLVADRQRPGGQSLLAKTLVDRAREIAEAMKVHRIPSSDHVVIALLIEPLQSQDPEDSQGFHGFWLSAATRHLFDMQVNHKAVMTTIQDPEARGTMIFAWWMTCLADAYSSVYYRRKPMLDDDDYDIDFYTADPIAQEGLEVKPSPREQLEFLGYYRAAHALARVSRQMSRQLWRPAVDADGVPLEVLLNLRQLICEWRDQYLPQVGVPTNFKAEWDFISAISACASDATYHLMWIILFNAMDDFGIRDSATMSDDVRERVVEVERKIMDEAIHGALRIAGLAGVLASNGYLRLDPAVMHVSCIRAGTLLARLGRPEVSNCISGLEQYSYAYEEAGDQVAEMKRAYNAARGGEFDFNHMSSVVPRVEIHGHQHAMLIDHMNGTSSQAPSHRLF